MAGGKKTINRRFELYSEALLEDYKVFRVLLILAHLAILLLGITALLIGVLAYNPGSIGGPDPLPFVNCTLALQFQSGPQFPVHLQLLLTGIGLIAMDINVSLLLCVVKKLTCGVLAIIWFLIGTLCVTAWTVWSMVYAGLAFPIWDMDRGTCDNLVFISMLVGVGLMCLFMVLYWIIALVAMVYDCWYRCDLECVCTCKKRESDFDW